MCIVYSTSGDLIVSGMDASDMGLARRSRASYHNVWHILKYQIKLKTTGSRCLSMQVYNNRYYAD